MAAVASPEYVTLAGMLALITGGYLSWRGCSSSASSPTSSRAACSSASSPASASRSRWGRSAGCSASRAVRRHGREVRRAPSGHLGESNAATVWVSRGRHRRDPGARRRSRRRIPGALIAVVGAIVVELRSSTSRPTASPTLGRGAERPAELRLPLGHLGAVRRPARHRRRHLHRRARPRAPPPRAPTPRSTRSRFDENVDLVGLGLANAAPASAGPSSSTAARPRPRWSTAPVARASSRASPRPAIVLIVLLFLTEATAVHADGRARRRSCSSSASSSSTSRACAAIYRVRRDEFVIAAITGLLVIVVGVEQAIIVAIVVSVIDHLRRSYAPKDAVVVSASDGHYRALPVASGRTAGTRPRRVPVHLGPLLRQREPVQRGDPRPRRRCRRGSARCTASSWTRRPWSTSTTAAG